MYGNIWWTGDEQLTCVVSKTSPFSLFSFIDSICCSFFFRVRSLFSVGVRPLVSKTEGGDSETDFVSWTNFVSKHVEVSAPSISNSFMLNIETQKAKKRVGLKGNHNLSPHIYRTSVNDNYMFRPITSSLRTTLASYPPTSNGFAPKSFNSFLIMRQLTRLGICMLIELCSGFAVKWNVGQNMSCHVMSCWSKHVTISTGNEYVLW